MIISKRAYLLTTLISKSPSSTFKFLSTILLYCSRRNATAFAKGCSITGVSTCFRRLRVKYVTVVVYLHRQLYWPTVYVPSWMVSTYPWLCSIHIHKYIYMIYRTFSGRQSVLIEVGFINRTPTAYFHPRLSPLMQQQPQQEKKQQKALANYSSIWQC